MEQKNILLKNEEKLCREFMTSGHSHIAFPEDIDLFSSCRTFFFAKIAIRDEKNTIFATRMYKKGGFMGLTGSIGKALSGLFVSSTVNAVAQWEKHMTLEQIDDLERKGCDVTVYRQHYGEREEKKRKLRQYRPDVMNPDFYFSHKKRRWLEHS